MCSEQPLFRLPIYAQNFAQKITKYLTMKRVSSIFVVVFVIPYCLTQNFWEKNMRKVLGTVAFLLAVSVVAPAFTFAQDAPKEEKKEMKKKAKKEKKEKTEKKEEKMEEKKK